MKLKKLINILKNINYNSVYINMQYKEVIFYYNNNKHIYLKIRNFYIEYTLIRHKNWITLGFIPIYNLINYISIWLIINKQFNIRKKEIKKEKYDFNKIQIEEYNTFLDEYN